MKDKDWVNIMGSFYCAKMLCRQMATLRPFLVRRKEAPKGAA
jgi:hypothetical protein